MARTTTTTAAKLTDGFERLYFIGNSSRLFLRVKNRGPSPILSRLFLCTLRTEQGWLHRRLFGALEHRRPRPRVGGVAVVRVARKIFLDMSVLVVMDVVAESAFVEGRRRKLPVAKLA